MSLYNADNEYNISNNIETKNGWQNCKTTMPVETISVRMSVSDFELTHGFDHERLKIEFANQISKEIVNLINFRMRRESFTKTTIYETDLHIVKEPKSKNYMVDKEHFVWEGKTWNQDEIVKALKIAYPQYSI